MTLQSTFVSYTIDDGYGSVDVKKWHEKDEHAEFDAEEQDNFRFVSLRHLITFLLWR